MSYINTLKEFAGQFKDLANFNEGEQINPVSFGKIQKTKSWSGWFSPLNAVTGQNSDSAINEIKSLFEGLKQFLNKSSNDPLTIYKRLKYFYSLKTSVLQTAESSFKEFKDTCQKAKAGLVLPSDDKAKELGDRVEALRNILLKEIIPLLDKKIHHINTDLTNAKLVPPEDLITYLFNKNNSIILSQSCYSAEHIKTTLKEFFGKRIVDEVFSFYHLESKGVLKLADIQAISIGIKANLTLDDITYLAENQTFLKKAFPELLSFKNLNESTILFILLKLRNTYYRLDIDFSQSSPTYSAQLKRDLIFLETCDLQTHYGWNKNFKHPLYNLQHYGESEFLAKDFIYGLYSVPGTQFSKGILFPCHTMNRGDKEKKISCLQAWPLPHGKGIYPALIFPMAPQENAPLKAKIIFRGTADPDSINRDISFFEIKTVGTIEGIGAKSFDEALPSLREALKSTFDEIKTKYKIPYSLIELLGHSLGGSDIARLLADLVKQLETMKDVYPSIKLFAFNSPAISEQECMDFLIHSEKFPDVPIHCTYFKVLKDLYQEGGLMLPGYFTEKQQLPKNVTVTVIILDRVNKYNQGTCLQGIAETGSAGVVDLTINHTKSKHGHRCFTLNDDSNRHEENPTHVVGIYTNNEEDMTLKAKGKEGEEIIVITDPNQIPQHLIAMPGYYFKTAVETIKTGIQFFTTPVSK